MPVSDSVVLMKECVMLTIDSPVPTIESVVFVREPRRFRIDSKVPVVESTMAASDSHQS
jgi:hypothetical protein